MENSSLDSKTSGPHVFESQAEKEKVLLLMRAHAVTNIPWIVVTLILVALPPILAHYNILKLIDFNLNVSAGNIYGLVLLWYLFVFAFAFQQFLSWYFNVYIVTSERVVDFDFYQLFYRRISSTELVQIEDVTTSSGGIPQLIFNYGNVFIQTAGEVNEFEFIRIPNPSNVQKIIEQAIESEREEDGNN